MGTNWFPGNNPESIPRYGYIPKIVLPTVFGDALSYLEMIGRYNAEFNKAIDGINKLAENIETEVQNSVENAKIPVYAELVNNGSAIISPNNWNVDNPEALYEAMGAGKLCILHGNLSFNIDGLPVVQATNNMYFILTQFYQSVVSNNNTTVYAVFVNYDETHVRFAKLSLYKENNIYSSEITDMREVHLPTDIEFEQIDNLFKKCVFLYKGRENIPDEQGQYIELMENATENDLSRFFVVQTGGSMHVPECAPAVCVDCENGNVGELRYGGNGTPWARVYSYGIKLNSNFAGAILHLTEVDGELLDAIGANSAAINGVNERVDGVRDALTALGENVDDKDGENVKYTLQARSTAEKGRARLNIGAAPTDNPVFTGELALGNGLGASVLFNVTTQGGVTALDFSQSPVRIKGVVSPVNETDVATKQYVDNHSGGSSVSNGVSYDVQSPSDTEKATARSNIGAVADENGTIIGYLSLQNGNENAVALVPGRNGTDDTLTFVGDNGNVLVRGVKTPELNSDAVNKEYCDTMKPLVMNLQNDGHTHRTDVTGNQVRAAIAVRRPIYGVLADVDYPYLNNAVIAFNLMNPGGNEMDYLSAIVAGEGVKYKIIVEFHTSAYVRYYVTTVVNGTITNLVLPDEQRPDDFAQISYSQGGIDFSVEGNPSYPVILNNIADGANAKCAATKGYVDSKYGPYYVNINNGENAWSGTKDDAAITNLASVIRGYADGAKVAVSFPTTGVAGVGYAYPKCASLDYGIIVEAYDGTAWKRYVINRDGTVTTTTL